VTSLAVFLAVFDVVFSGSATFFGTAFTTGETVIVDVGRHVGDLLFCVTFYSNEGKLFTKSQELGSTR
jgi:hypothetical protein